MANIYKRRIARVRQALHKEEYLSALLLSSALPAQRSRDVSYPYRQNSDFYYLTGSTLKELVLLVSPRMRTPVLFALRADKSRIMWEGKAPGPQQVAQQIGAELIVTADPAKEALARLKGIECLYFDSQVQSIPAKIVRQLMLKPPHGRVSLPARFAASDLIMDPLRLFKEPEEIALIIKAAEITSLALHGSLPYIQAGISEIQLAAMLDCLFKLEGAEAAFSTIVACGKNAATLHHSPAAAKLKNRDLVLIDCGAQYKMYCADMTRTLPVDGVWRGAQKDFYEIVLSAQRAAISAIRPGVKVHSVHHAAAREITAGLLELGILKGRVSKLMAEKAYKPFFPHGIGHSLGLDVHDAGPIRENEAAALEAGMVLTVEPGIYLPKRTAGHPPLGLRLEDDVAVTRRGAAVLSGGFPKTAPEIERLLAETVVSR